jgi:peroxiredoxin
MHRLILAVVSMSLALAVQAGPRTGTLPMDFAARALDGGNYRLSEYRGDVVALVFWGTWCGDCRARLGTVERLWRTYSAAGFMAIGVNLDEKPDAARALIRAVGTTYPNVRDTDKRISRAFDADSLPMVVLLDRSGGVRFVTSGASDDDGSTTDMVRRLLDE